MIRSTLAFVAAAALLGRHSGLAQQPRFRIIEVAPGAFAATWRRPTTRPCTPRELDAGSSIPPRRPPGPRAARLHTYFM